MKYRDVIDSILVAIVAVLSRSLTALPWGVTLGLGTFFGGIAYYLSPNRRRVGIKNLRNAFGSLYSHEELARILRKAYQDMGCNVAEIVAMPKVDDTHLREHLGVKGDEGFQKIMDQGKGAILITGHFGNWELGNHYACARGFPLTVLARDQKFERLYSFLNSRRSSRGSVVVSKGMNMRQLIHNLRGGGLLALLSDQDAGRNGIWAPLFGTIASVPKGSFVIALRAGAPMVPVFVIREQGTKHRIELEEPLEVRPGSFDEQVQDLCVQFNQRLEKQVSANPTQWLWAHKRWKSSPVRRILILDDGKLGHLRQSEAVADMARGHFINQLGQRGYDPELIEVRARSVRVEHVSAGRRKRMLLLSGMALLRPWLSPWLLRTCLTPDTLQALNADAPDLIVSCGSATAPLNLLLGNLYGSKCVVVQRAPVFGSKGFDLAILPRHDVVRVRHNEVAVLGALNALASHHLDRAAEFWRAQLKLGAGESCVGLLIGGDSKHCVWDGDSLPALVSEVLELSKSLGFKVLLTTSRRTPKGAEQAIR
ncbi:MAG: mitochondrial fission ELM1 family protein, partial [Candidatus Omnitrophica bacterium]|nr:mitochondrial fission ELM1 family protein [Candidatus Omnitrophota bacterium]